MEHVSVDLETLGVGARAAIASIGAVLFDPIRGEIGASFYQVVNLSGYDFRDDFEFDSSTLRWWLQQSDAARAMFKEPGTYLGDALSRFREFFPDGGKLWGYGPSFDCALLKHAYERTARPIPWTRREERCVRTVVALASAWPGFRTPEQVGTTHNARDDAEYQARLVCESYRVLGMRAVTVTAEISR